MASPSAPKQTDPILKPEQSGSQPDASTTSVDSGEAGLEVKKKGFFSKLFRKGAKKNTVDSSSGVKPPKKKRRFTWVYKVIVVFLVLILIIVAAGGVLAILVYPPAMQAKGAVDQLQVNGQQLVGATKERDLVKMKFYLSEINTNLTQIDDAMEQLSWASDLPYAKEYYQDGQHGVQAGYALREAGNIAFEAITPYADLLGLKTAEGNAPDPETAQDRIEFIVTTLNSLNPQLESIAEQLSIAESHISQINPERYPEEFNGVRVQEILTQGQVTLKQAKILLTDARPLLNSAPYILGIEEPRTYLVLFQNDAELRPTGGFLTAYALLEVNSGKVTPLFSSDIYDLDDRYSGRVAPPDALIQYIEDPYAKESRSGSTRWRLRDMNMSPDFKVSMEQFYEAYKETGSRQVDGIIAVDTKFFVNLLDVIGPVGVSGYGNFSSEIVEICDCPQAVYELESAISYETPYIRENRKAILGPVMNSVLSNALAQPKEKMAALVDSAIKGIQQKNVIMYFPDETVQQAVESFNLAGRVVEYPGDYMMLVDTNLGGAKSHLYIEQEMTLDVEVHENSTKNTLTIRYKNPQAHDGWLNGDSPDYVRLYVPAGSKLLDSQGSELEVTTTEDLGKTVFEGFFVLRPKGLHTLTFTYETPIDADNTYSMLIQKQGGAKNHPMTVTVNSQTQEFELNADKELVFSL